jgi:uncharacterized protein YcaQ
MTFEIPILRESELKRLIIVGSNLHSWQGNGDKGIREIIKEIGFVQLDPLNPAGRYHDVFFSARIPDYKQGQFEKLVYKENLVFETHFHNLNAISIDHFPFFNSYTGKEHMGRYYSRLLKNLEDLGESNLLDDVFNHVKEQGLTKSSDLASLGKADPKYASWKSSRKSGTVLEILWAMGKLVIVQRDTNFRKIYDLTTRYIKKELLDRQYFSERERQNYRLKLKLQAFTVISVGKISYTKQGKLKTSKKVDFSIENLPTKVVDKNHRTPCLVMSENDKGYIVPSNWEELLKESIDNEMRGVGPLDPLIWDRDLLKYLFGFDYLWEVYKKAEDRIWGYYVYPLLYKGEFIGRFEAKLDKKLKLLKFFNFQKEPTFDFDRESIKAFGDLLLRWKHMLDADSIEFDNSIPKEASEV